MPRHRPRAHPNFLGLRGELATLGRAKYVILPVPYERTTSYGKGTKGGPLAILRASQQLEFFDEELLRETCRAGIYTAPFLRLGGKNFRKDLQRIARRVEEFLRQEKTVITLGGEHTITVGSLQPYIRRYPDLTVVQVDAHADLRDTYQGTPYSHACVMRRLIEKCRTVHVGIRSLSSEEARVIRDRKLSVWFARDLHRPGWQEEVVQSLSPHVYFTLDVDGLDPSIMPSTGTPEPGGLGWYELLSLLRLLCARTSMVGADVTELRPRRDNPAPDFLVAKFVYRLIGYVEARSESS